MNNGDMPAAPTFEIHQDCGFDGNSGPELVQTINPGLTKREMFAMAAMQGAMSNSELTKYAAKLSKKQPISGTDEAAVYCEIAVQYADALLEALEK